MSVIRTNFLLIRILWTELGCQGKGGNWKCLETHLINICQKQDPGIPAWRQRLTYREEVHLSHVISYCRLHKMLLQGVLERWDIWSIASPQNNPCLCKDSIIQFSHTRSGHKRTEFCSP